MKTPQYFDRIFNWKQGTAKDLEDSMTIAKINTITTAYTLKREDHGKIIEVDSTVTLTLPNNLPNGFNCSIVNVGSGVVTLSATTLRSSVATITSQYGAATVYLGENNIWTAIGGLD